MRPSILQLLPALNVGGVELSCLDSIKAISTGGFLPLVVSAGGSGVEQLTADGGRHIALPVGAKNPITAYAKVRQLCKIIKQYNVCLVHAHSRMPAWVGMVAARRCGVPFVTSFHGAYNYGNFAKHYYNSVMVRGDHVFAVSNFIRDHILSHYGKYAETEKISVLYNGIDLKRFDRGKVNEKSLQDLRGRLNLPTAEGREGKWIVMVGRATRLKGHELVMRALGDLPDNINTLFIVPDITDSSVSSLQKTIADLSLAGQVHFRSLPQEILPLVYGFGDIYLLASMQAESFGRVIVEAQAMGGVVVASALGGVLELVHDKEDGFLFRSGDSDDLTRVIKVALDLPAEKRKQIKENAVRNSKKFGLDIYEKNLIAGYEKIL